MKAVLASLVLAGAPVGAVVLFSQPLTVISQTGHSQNDVLAYQEKLLNNNEKFHAEEAKKQENLAQLEAEKFEFFEKIEEEKRLAEEAKIAEEKRLEQEAIAAEEAALAAAAAEEVAPVEETVSEPVAQVASSVYFTLQKNLAGLEPMFIEIGNMYGVDPKILAAIASWETGHGTSSLFLNHNNFGGVKATDRADYITADGWSGYNSQWNGLADKAYLLANYYDTSSIEAIQPSYCPLSDAGCEDWVRGVSSIYNSL